uniref:Uncharacterized protein n=1 Tax=viral metagenome TaxID=1070528 RepID=A0A6M3KVK7_9ZZZZ
MEPESAGMVDKVSQSDARRIREAIQAQDRPRVVVRSAQEIATSGGVPTEKESKLTPKVRESKPVKWRNG